MFAYPLIVLRYADRHHWRHHAVLDLAVFAENQHTRIIIYNMFYFHHLYDDTTTDLRFSQSTIFPTTTIFFINHSRRTSYIHEDPPIPRIIINIFIITRGRCNNFAGGIPPLQLDIQSRRADSLTSYFHSFRHLKFNKQKKFSFPIGSSNGLNLWCVRIQSIIIPVIGSHGNTSRGFRYLDIDFLIRFFLI